MSELVKVVRPVHAPGEFVLMAEADMVEGEALFVDEAAKAEADRVAAEAEAKAKAEADAANKAKGK
jgi:hypothetical protein